MRIVQCLLGRVTGDSLQVRRDWLTKNKQITSFADIDYITTAFTSQA